MNRSIIHLICAILALAPVTPALAQSDLALQNQEDTTNAQDQTFAKTIRPFFEKHCTECHGEDLAEGELRLDNLAPDFVNRPAADHWIEVLDRINLGEMPPEDEPRPDEKLLLQVTDWISAQMQRARDQSESTGGRVLLRRMTRLEYANTVRDLLQVEFIEGEGPIDLLPPDGSIRGFDRNSNALLVDPSLMNAYLEVAALVADRAVRFRPPLVPQRTVRFEYRDMVGSSMQYQIEERSAYLDGETLVVMQGAARSYSKLRHPFDGREVPITGRYRVRIQAAADPGESGKPVYMRVKQGPDENIAQFRIDARPDAPEIYEFETIRDDLLQGEYGVEIVDGTEFGSYVGSRGTQQREADELLKQGLTELGTTAKARLRAQGDHANGAYHPEVLKLDGLPKLRLDWIEVTGPLQGEFPPQSMKTIFFDGWEQQKLDLDYARRIFARMLPRAYRRKVTEAEIDEVLQLVQNELREGADYQTAIKTGIVAMLCSPKFLYLYEPVNADDAPRRLNEFEFASRLSYFLWSSKPDDKLFLLASQQKLYEPQTLDSEVDRLLNDPRVEGFLQGFVRQWLKIDEFDRFPPDQAIFPEYYTTELVGLDDDIPQQPLAMMRELIAKDQSLLNLLDSDWTMVNERLARFYGIDGVKGESFQRVDFQSRQVWEQAQIERFKDQPSISSWFEAGPFKADSFEAAMEKEFGPEKDERLREQHDDGSEDVNWQIRDYEDSVTHSPWQTTNAAFYLARWIVVSNQREIEMRFGSDDAIRVWFNGEHIINAKSNGGVRPNQERATVALKKGRNLLLMKIVNGGGQGGFWFETDLSNASSTDSLSNSSTNNLVWALSIPIEQRGELERRAIEAEFTLQSPAAIRGGLLGMAGIHRWGSDGSRTKPVERGKYILDVMFNDPPPPPPPNAGEVEPNVQGENLTVAQRLARHREQITCNNCHRRIDPYGLAMENFNVIGQWRNKIDGEKPLNRWGGDRPAIVIGGILPGGESYDNFVTFKEALSQQDERFLRGVTEKLLMYSLARTIEPGDRPLIDEAVSNCRDNGNSMRAIIKTIVASETFQRK